jgi:hypothetical protein
MRILLAMTLFAVACGGSQPKKEGSMVTEGDQSPTCCCKTEPTTAEKELIPTYAMTPRMECSTSHGSCVDDVQCANQPAQGETTESTPSNDGVPPPPTLTPSP